MKTELTPTDIINQANNDWRIAGFEGFCGLIVAHGEPWIAILASVERDLFYLEKTIDKVNDHERSLEETDPGTGWKPYSKHQLWQLGAQSIQD